MSQIILKGEKKVLSLLLLLVLLTYTPTNTQAAYFDGCDHEYTINAGYSYLQSPNYPQYWPAGTSCRYRFTAPLDYEIQLNCTININKGTNGCSSEYFYVARDGDKQLRGSEQFCGQGSVIRKTVFRSIALAYISGGSWGRFECSLYAQPQACDCGWSVSTKIVNGQETSPNAYPSVVALRDTSKSSQVFCSGTIVSHRHIITAAHCTRVQSDPSNIIARAGEHNLATSGETQYEQQYSIVQIREHPSYTTNPVTNDISILVTGQIIEWSRGVGPACLPPSNYANTDFSYQYVDVLGWGTTSFGGPTSNVLRKVQLQTTSLSTCQQSYQGISTITSSQICTYDSAGAGKDSCQYDSGGPVILTTSRQFLLGIISFGKACGGAYAMGVNTLIPKYLPWIQSNIGSSNCPVTTMQ